MKCCICKQVAPDVEFSKGSRRCKGCQRDYHNQWYQRNKERVKQKVSDWGRANPDKVREYTRKTRANNPELYRVLGKQWRDKNPERMAELKRDWLAANPHKITEYNSLRRARGGSRIPADDIARLRAAQPQCLCCGSGESLTIDHVIPLSAGGDNSLCNLQILCSTCNKSKGVLAVDYRHLLPVDRRLVLEG